MARDVESRTRSVAAPVSLEAAHAARTLGALMTMKISLTVLSGLFYAMALASTHALAQDATGEAGTTKTKQDQVPTQLSEVIVTAQKRSERIQDVPVSMSVINASALASKDSVQLQDYLAGVPGVSVGDLGNGRTQVVIRGISTGFGNNPTTGFTIDDVPVGSSTSNGLGDVLVPNLDPSDLARVEILRGPQGTLYGASSMGGLVRYVTAAPSLDAFNAELGTDGSWLDRGDDGYAARGFASVPVLPGKLGMRISGFYQHDPGFIDDPQQGRSHVNSGRTYGGLLSTLWRILPGVDLRLTALSQNQSAGASATEDVNQAGIPIYGDLTHERLPGTDGFDEKFRLYAATLTADLKFATLTSITGYNQSDASFPQDVSPDFTPFTPMIYGESLPIRINQSYETNKLSQEVRLASPNNHHLEWLVGAFYTHENTPVDEFIFPVDQLTGAALPLPELIAVDGHSIYKEEAGFANLTYYFTPRLDLSVGGRYSRNQQDYSEIDQGLLIGPAPSTTQANFTGHSATYLVTPQFRISDSLVTYFRVASGYRPGGPNSGAVPGVPSRFAPDTTVNYELGVKGDTFGHRLTYAADVFYIDWSNIQIREVDVNNGFSYYGNASKALSRGAELSLQARPVAGLTLSANLSYTDALLTAAAPSAAGVFAPAGSRLPNSSKWNGGVSAEEEVPLTASVDGFGSVTITYTGDRLAGFQPTASSPRFLMPSYTTVDLQLGTRIDLWTLSLFVRNLTNRRGFLDANNENSVSGSSGYYASIIQPRTLGLSVARKFF